MVFSLISSSQFYQEKKEVIYWNVVFPLKRNYQYLRLTTSDLYAYHKTKEIENWYIEYFFDKADWDLRYVEKRKTIRGVDVFDRLECYHADIQKEVDDWFFETNSIERQRLNLSPIQQAIKRADGSEKRELSKWYSVDPEYLNRVERMIFEKRYLYGEPPKMIFIEQVMRLCTYRYYMEFWNAINSEKRFRHWIKAKEIKEKHDKIIVEREEYFVAMREKNQARRQAAVKIEPEKNAAEILAERFASLVMWEQDQARRQAGTLKTVLDSGGWIESGKNPAEILTERHAFFVTMRKQNQARRQAAVKIVSDEDNGGWM